MSSCSQPYVARQASTRATVELEVIHQQSLHEYSIVQSFPEEPFGLHLRGNLISHVRSGTPADRAGMQEGHIVLSVNGVGAVDRSTDEIIGMMRNTHGTSRMVTMPQCIYQAIEKLSVVYHV